MLVDAANSPKKLSFTVFVVVFFTQNRTDMAMDGGGIVVSEKEKFMGMLIIIT